MAGPFTDETTHALVGAQGSATLLISAQDTAIAAGSGDLPVLATPRMIALMEEAACAALAGSLPDGWTSVGTRIDVRHVAPTPVGATVTATARVTEAGGRRCTFDVVAEVDGTRVGSGTHDRVAVERDAFLAALVTPAAD